MTALVPFDVTKLPALSNADDAAFNELSKGGNYLPTLRLYGGGSDACKMGLIAPGHYGVYVSKDKIEDLGERIDVVPFAKRTQAVDWEASVRSYDSASETFQSIDARARGLNGESRSPSCDSGTAFLVLERSTGRLFELYFGKPSTRPLARDVAAHMPQPTMDPPRPATPATLGVELVQGKYTYHKPTVSECSTPFAKVPDAEPLIAEITKFVTAKEAVELADTPANERTR